MITTDQKRRFWAKVVPNGSCWEWTGYKNPQGYGRLRSNKQSFYAHCFAYRTSMGEIPQGMEVLHDCDNPACVRPDHLFVGTHKQNMVDCIRRGRHSSAKLSVADVKTIDALNAQGLSNREISERFGVSDSTICTALSRKRWSFIPKSADGRKYVVSGDTHGQSKLNSVQVVEIRRKREEGATYTSLAEEYGVSAETIARAARRETWRNV